MQELMKRLSSKWQSLIDIFDTTWELKLCKSTWTILCSQRSAFLLHSKINELMLTTQPANFKEVTLRKTPSALLSNPANYPRKTPFHLHGYPTLLNTPSKSPFRLHSLSNPAWKPKKNAIPLALLSSPGNIPRTIPFYLHSLSNSVWHSMKNSIPTALLFNPALLSKENIPFHLPCNLVLLYMYTPRKISFHLHCNLILLYPPWKFPFLLDWYLIRSPFHLHCYPLLQQGFISSVIQWCSALVSLQKANERLVTDSLWCISKVEYISLAQAFP